ncbi:MAG: hypothetical protein FJ009_10160 [Chloroflexi bacterium]|nr:hypothetical protein [Chloroflexota bacterium]
MRGSSPPTARSAWSHLSPNQQIGYGCLAIAVIGAFVLYCAGTFSILVRPTLVQRAPTPTIITRVTNQRTPTRPPATLINLPGGTLLATPTQAPIPTRELPTIAPTLDLTSTAPITGTASPGSATRTPTRRVTGTVTQPPRP